MHIEAKIELTYLALCFLLVVFLHVVIDAIPVEIVVTIISVYIPLITCAWLLILICSISERVLFVRIPFPFRKLWLVNPIVIRLLSAVAEISEFVRVFILLIVFQPDLVFPRCSSFLH